MGAVMVVVGAVLFKHETDSPIESKTSRVNSSSLSLELNDSMRPFCQGEPGSQ